MAPAEQGSANSRKPRASNKGAMDTGAWVADLEPSMLRKN